MDGPSSIKHFLKICLRVGSSGGQSDRGQWRASSMQLVFFPQKHAVDCSRKHLWEMHPSAGAANHSTALANLLFSDTKKGPRLALSPCFY